MSYKGFENGPRIFLKLLNQLYIQWRHTPIATWIPSRNIMVVSLHLSRLINADEQQKSQTQSTTSGELIDNRLYNEKW